MQSYNFVVRLVWMRNSIARWGCSKPVLGEIVGPREGQKVVYSQKLQDLRECRLASVVRTVKSGTRGR
jgi:hypothetical protein